MWNIKEIEEEIKKLELELQEAKEYNKTNWKPKKGEKFYFINFCGETDWEICTEIDKMDYVINNTKTFKTREEANDYLEYITAKKEYSTEFTTEDWKNEDIEKCQVSFSYISGKLFTSYNNFTKHMNMTYFTEEKVQEFMKKYEKQILKFEFGIEEEK